MIACKVFLQVKPKRGIQHEVDRRCLRMGVAWTGLAFLATACPWGAFPGHTLDDVGSGIGFAHNTFMFDRPQRVVVQAPWRPFPRNILSGKATLLPRPPWFVTNRRQHVLGRLLTRFQHSPGWLKLPRIFVNALRG